MSIKVDKLIASGLMLSPLFFFNHAMADVGGSFYTLEIEQGEWEVESSAETLGKRNAERESGLELGLGYGMTDYWSTEIAVKYLRENSGGTGLEAIEWENVVKLTESSRFPVEIGFVVELERPRERSEGYQLTFGPLFQKDIGQMQLNANLLFERHFSETLHRSTEMGYQWQVKYNWRPTFAFGLQGFGDMGEWDDWAPREEQLHRFGPAVFGNIVLDHDHEIEYKASYLTDPSKRTRSRGFRLEAEYKF